MRKVKVGRLIYVDVSGHPLLSEEGQAVDRQSHEPELMTPTKVETVRRQAEDLMRYGSPAEALKLLDTLPIEIRNKGLKL